MERLSARVRCYVAFTAAAAAGVAVAAVRADGAFHWRLAIGFGILCFLAEQFPISLVLGSSYSVSFVITIAATVAAGPGEAAIANAFGATPTVRALRGQRPARLAFNAAQLIVSAGAGGLAYRAAGGLVATTEGLFPRVIVPILACTAVNFALNTALVSVAVGLSEGRSPLGVWRRQYAPLGLGYVAFAWLGLLLAMLYLEMGWGSVVFLLVPLLVARNAFEASVKMEGAYDATVRGMMRAIEAKDPYTRGHAERVSRLAAMAAREYGLPEERVREVRYAALMHDIGKLMVHTHVLQKSGKLTGDEYEHMKVHSALGAALVSEIDLLAPVMDGVRHHHERMDGGGYPDGLRGEAIPLVARLIMVSDAFDAMTSTRSYRPAKAIGEAFAELRRCAGTQFDAHALAALERAVARQGWEPRPEAAASRVVEMPLPSREEGNRARAGA